MNTDDILKVKEFVKNNRCMMLRIILLRMIKEGSFDDIQKYINHFEAHYFKNLSTDDIFLRLKYIDKALQSIKEARDGCSFMSKVFTNFQHYNIHKSKFERVKNESKITFGG